MEISLTHNFIFLHIGKTAGSNVSRAIAPYVIHPENVFVNRYLDRLGIHFNYWGPIEWRRFRRHATARTAKRYLPAAFYDNVFKFAFVRNPWDWWVSLYHFLLRKTSHRHHLKVKAMSGFEEYLRFEIKRQKRFQYEFVTDRSGRLIVDFIGRFEHLHEHFAIACRHMHIPVPEIPAITFSPKRDYRSYYTGRTCEMVADQCAKDIEMFGYTFDPKPLNPILADEWKAEKTRILRSPVLGNQ